MLARAPVDPGRPHGSFKGIEIMELMLIIWLLSAALCGVIANTKRRSVPAWLAIGFATGVLGPLIIACLPPLEAGKATEATN
jgi:hypothetical protein